MEIKRISYENPMDRYYFQGFYDELLSKMSDDNLTPDFDTFFAALTNPTGRHVWSCIVAVEEGKVVGGVSMSYLPKSACAVIEFAAVLGDNEELLSELVTTAVSMLRADNHTLLHVFAELTEEEKESPAWFNKVKCVNMNYRAPAIKPDASVAHNLELVVIDDPATALEGALVTSFVREYFENCYPKTDEMEDYIPKFGRGAVVELL